MTAKLYAVEPRREVAQTVRRVFGRCLREAIRYHGDGLRGFAFVAWDERGAGFSGKSTPYGPVSESLLPSYVHDVLARQVTVDMIAPEHGDDIDGAG